jgi:hypothetical protein
VGASNDGHHLNLNTFVLGDQLVMTPTFMGSEPVVARVGGYKGTRVFAAEEGASHALMGALSDGERQQATSWAWPRAKAERDETRRNRCVHSAFREHRH